MQCNKNSLSILVSPAFLVGLGLLLLNDFFLKPTFHNWFTGKLSDFAGLFIFPLFFTAFFSERKRWIYAVTAIGFMFWKSGLSQPLIELWNAQPYYHLDRVVDYTDLLGLLILPLSFLYGRPSQQRQATPLLVYVSCVVAVFTFAATSWVQPKTTFYFFKEYQFNLTPPLLLERMKRLANLRFDGKTKEFQFRSLQSLPLTFEIGFEDYHYQSVLILVNADGAKSKISLLSVMAESYKQEDKEKVLLFFEKEFIEELRKEPVRKSSQINAIWFRE